MVWPNKKFRASGDESKLDREISFHVEEPTQANIAAGMTPEEARRRALVDFGGQEQVKQQIREVHISAMVDGLRSNLRSAMRFIRRSPSFAIAGVLTLALGIGANSAVFSAIDAILLRPLPFPHGDELVEALWDFDFRPVTYAGVLTLFVAANSILHSGCGASRVEPTDVLREV
jgi:putative ABC transport system permease protein